MSSPITSVHKTVTKCCQHNSRISLVSSRGGTIAPPGLPTLRVDLLGDLQSVRVGQVSVGRRDGQDEAALLGDELHQHVPDLVLDVLRLVSDGHFGHAR